MDPPPRETKIPDEELHLNRGLSGGRRRTTSVAMGEPSGACAISAARFSRLQAACAPRRLEPQQNSNGCSPAAAGSAQGPHGISTYFISTQKQPIRVVSGSNACACANLPYDVCTPPARARAAPTARPAHHGEATPRRAGFARAPAGPWAHGITRGCWARFGPARFVGP